MTTAQPRNRLLPVLIALLSVVLTTGLIIGTYSVFDQFYDEGAHLACGIEWLDQHTYVLEALHPPLARVSAAILPYLDGARGQGFRNLWVEGNAILEHNGEYGKTLTLARLGTLPFFWVTCFLVWRFMARNFSDWHAAIAVFFVAFCPVMLGHSGVAATDAPLVATFLLAMLALRALLEKGKWTAAAVAGLTAGLAALTKFTALPFLACSGGMLFLYYWISRKKFSVGWKAVVLAALVFGFTVWAGYRFSHGPIVVQSRLAADEQAKLAISPSWERKVYLFPYMPADEFVLGLKEARLQGGTGRKASYLMGQVYNGGRWYFFPIAVLVKTQIAMLLFFLAGTAVAVFSRNVGWGSKVVFLLAGLLGPLLVGMAGTMNIGLRHVLPIYPFMAMLAAVGVAYVWRLRMGRGLTLAVRALVVLLVAWNVVSCLRAAPDFVAYFNEVAAPHASSILVESDLDWGQDLKRLNNRLNQVQADSVWIAYFGAADLSKRLSANPHVLSAGDRPSGWVAISEAKLRKYPGDYGWLMPYLYERVGRSIRLYHFASPPGS